VANSKGLAVLAERADGTHASTIPNGVDVDFFRPAAHPPDDRSVRCLFVGRFQSQKNLPYLMEQFAKVAKRSDTTLRLTLVGDGPQRGKLEVLARELGIKDRVEWTGWLDKHSLRNAYQAADIFVNPSLYEGMPNAVLEAMACGLPVVASRVPGNDELIQDGYNGSLFSLDDPNGLSAAVAQLVRAGAFRRTMGGRGRAMACANYSWSSVANAYLNLFDQPTPVSDRSEQAALYHR
jgi:glycosyltransferase involved in cell wall biosynthesis